MSKRTIRIIQAITAVAVMCAVLSFVRLPASADGPVSGERYYLPLFETSDTHGYLAEISGDTYEYRLAYISDKVKDVRGYGDAFRKDKALLLDGGDIYQGNSLSNLLDGRSLSASYQLMGYDAVTIGNHEFDWNIENTVDADGTMLDYYLDGTLKKNDVPVVVANLKKNGVKVDFASDYVILEKTAVSASGREMAVKIGVIGFASNYGGSIMASRFSQEGYTIDPDCEAVNKLAAELESSGKCDVTIILCHGEAAYMASALGSSTPVDLVLGGHTHQSVQGTTYWGLPYLQPACHGEAYAYCDLAFTFENGRNVCQGVSDMKTVSTQTNVRRLYDLPENKDELDPELVRLTDQMIDQISASLETVLGYITVSADKFNTIGGSGDRATTMGNWMCSMVRRAVGADVGFYNAGGVRTSILLESGQTMRQVTVSDVYTMFPFSNKIYLYDLTYREFLELLMYGMSDNGSTLLSRVEGIDVYYSGKNVTAVVRSDGIPVYADGGFKGDWADQHIRVAVSEFIATSDRKDGSRSNPLIKWSDETHLLYNEAIDVEGAVSVLRQEGAENGGLLTVDAKAHYINRTYKDAKWSLTTDGVLTLESGFSFGSDGAPWAAVADEIREVVIEFGLKSIPAGSFSGCENLKTVRYLGTASYWDWISISDPVILENDELTIICSDKVVRGDASAFVPSNDPEGEAVPDDGESPDGAPDRNGPYPEKSYSLPGILLLAFYIFAALSLVSGLAALIIVLVVRKKKRNKQPPIDQ